MLVLHGSFKSQFINILTYLNTFTKNQKFFNGAQLLGNWYYSIFLYTKNTYIILNFNIQLLPVRLQKSKSSHFLIIIKQFNKLHEA